MQGLHMRNWLDGLKRRVAQLKRDIVALWLAARHPETPLAAKAIAFVVLAYALSPIDLVPDFIPVLGYLDDLLLVPLGLALAISLIPDDLMTEFRDRADTTPFPVKSAAGAIGVIVIWLAALYVLARSMNFDFGVS